MNERTLTDDEMRAAYYASCVDDGRAKTGSSPEDLIWLWNMFTPIIANKAEAIKREIARYAAGKLVLEKWNMAIGPSYATNGYPGPLGPNAIYVFVRSHEPDSDENLFAAAVFTPKEDSHE